MAKRNRCGTDSSPPPKEARASGKHRAGPRSDNPPLNGLHDENKSRGSCEVSSGNAGKGLERDKKQANSVHPTGAVIRGEELSINAVAMEDRNLLEGDASRDEPTDEKTKADECQKSASVNASEGSSGQAGVHVDSKDGQGATAEQDGSIEEYEKKTRDQQPMNTNASHGEKSSGENGNSAANRDSDSSTTTVTQNQETPVVKSPAGNRKPAVADAVTYFCVIARRPRKGIQAFQISRTPIATRKQIKMWRNLPSLTNVQYGGEQYKLGELVYIYTGDEHDSPAILREIRDTGDDRGRKDIRFAWLWDRERADAENGKEAATKIWEKGATHMLTNDIAIEPWDTLNGHACSPEVRVDHGCYLDIHGAKLELRKNDQSSNW